MSQKIGDPGRTAKLIAKPVSQRQLRIEETIRQAVAKNLSSNNIRDDFLATAMLTVTRVSVSPDLKNATVYVVPLLQNIDAKRLREELKNATGEIKQAINKAIVLKHIPKLLFKLDDEFKRMNRVNALFSDPRF